MGGLDGYPEAWMIFCFGSVCLLKGWVHFVKTKLMICFLTVCKLCFNKVHFNTCSC